MSRHLLVTSLLLALAVLAGGCADDEPGPVPTAEATAGTGQTADRDAPADLPPLSPEVARALGWLDEAQHEDGGWGAGSHAHQDVRDPAAVPSDPATTAFVGLALLRADGGVFDDRGTEALGRALAFLVKAVEGAPAEGTKITTLEGTQPQTKLGAVIDTAMTAQFLARALALLPEDHALKGRAGKALDECLRRLEGSQQKDGAWSGGGGWAPVLQTSMATQAFELAQSAGHEVNEEVLERARDYQQANVDGDGAAGAAALGASAGVELYAVAGAGRAMAPRAGRAREVFETAKVEGRLPMDAPLSAENLKKAGVETDAEAEMLTDAASKMAAQGGRLAEDEALLSGFGSNGGEEYLSYMLTSESLVIAGGEAWTDWNAKMRERLAKIQSADGSWGGHHCITSPVFCTAAVVATLTVERDLASLRSADR